jgi:hypothetical protein
MGGRPYRPHEMLIGATACCNVAEDRASAAAGHGQRAPPLLLLTWDVIAARKDTLSKVVFITIIAGNV